ncbi:hypothetical protein TNCV_364011 [Trichonephila clavipes]|uniref:Uncharacterized protein n=1 Tax=Trichonephila clavipes TaxID=2585209 RepID=A0A8X6SGA9_TRICX|nr:hypothetical protein TNCV_364011 [Trichonephila clavipes]
MMPRCHAVRHTEAASCHQVGTTLVHGDHLCTNRNMTRLRRRPCTIPSRQQNSSSASFQNEWVLTDAMSASHSMGRIVCAERSMAVFLTNIISAPH